MTHTGDPSEPVALAEIHSAFLQPATAQRPMLRWWWPGGAVSLPELLAQLNEFAAAGWGGVEIQPFRVGLSHGLSAEQAGQVHEVFTPAWFELLGQVMAESQRLGLTVDLTFGSCWPFGGGDAITPERAACELSLDWTSVQGPGLWCGRPRQPERPLRAASWLAREGLLDPAQALPDGWAERLRAREATVAVLALRAGEPSLGAFAGFVPMTLPDRWGQVLAAGWAQAESTIDLTDQLQADGTLSWNVPPGVWQIVVCRRFTSDLWLGEAAGRGPQLVLDHFSREAFDAHAARVGDAALPTCQVFAGSTWRSVFIDSLELPADLFWTDDFETEFERRRGYRLRPHLPLLLQPGWRNHFQARRGTPLFDDPDVGPRVRADYRLTVSELMLERLYAPLQQWARRHGLQSKVQAHGAPVDWIQAYGQAGIPETEDLTGGAAPHFLRVARSAAHIYGRSLVSAEAFCWLVEGLAVTPRQLRERADQFFANGVQALVGHGAAAPLHGQPVDQRWYPFEAMEIGTQLDPGNPLWPLLRPLTDYIARCQTLLQRGRAVVPVAVLSSLDLFAFQGGGERMTAPLWHDALQAAGLDWDWLNADGLLHCTLEAGALVTPGGHRYRAVLLPALPALRAEVAERLATAAAAGVQVWALESIPHREEGWWDAEARDARVRGAMQAALHGGVRVCPPSQAGQRLRQAGLTAVVDWTGAQGMQFVLRKDGISRWLFLRNPTPESHTLCLTLPPNDVAERWDAWHGTRHWVGAAGSPVSLTLPAGQSCLLRLAASSTVQPAESATVPVGPDTIAPLGPSWQAQALNGPWHVRARGRGLHGRRIDWKATLSALCDLSQQTDTADFAGHVQYQVELPADLPLAEPLWLDLGQVHDAVQVTLNGHPLATLTEPPFVVNLQPACQAGAQTLTLRVANRPENALRDPACPGGIPLPGRRLSRLPTGLMGPVRLIHALASASPKPAA